jgi:hypothetical protein
MHNQHIELVPYPNEHTIITLLLLQLNTAKQYLKKVWHSDDS